MHWRRHTDEFSIILLLDYKTTKNVEDLRRILRPSPYRDDPPHVTLLKSIHTPKNMSDDKLYGLLKPTLDSFLKINPHAKISELANLRGGYYKKTGSLVLTSSTELHAEHRKLISFLKESGFKVGRREKKFYSPHATIRLGVALKDADKKEAGKLFKPGDVINFRSWVIYRLISKHGKRHFYEVQPT